MALALSTSAETTNLLIRRREIVFSLQEEACISKLVYLSSQEVTDTFRRNRNEKQVRGVKEPVKGPVRTSPGGYSVSRTFGDIKAKLPQFGGIRGVLSTDPEFKIFKLQKNNDFIFIGCKFVERGRETTVLTEPTLFIGDGIFDKMSSEEVVESAWRGIRESTSNEVHGRCEEAVETVISSALQKRSTDNLTGLLIAFSGLATSNQV